MPLLENCNLPLKQNSLFRFLMKVEWLEYACAGVALSDWTHQAVPPMGISFPLRRRSLRTSLCCWVGKLLFFSTHQVFS